MAHLACADAFVITADSVSMLSEACSTGYVPSMMIMKVTFSFHFLKRRNLGNLFTVVLNIPFFGMGLCVSKSS